MLPGGAASGEATEIGTDGIGRRWRLDVTVSWRGRTAVVRTVWILRPGEMAPGLLRVCLLRVGYCDV